MKPVSPATQITMQTLPQVLQAIPPPPFFFFDPKGWFSTFHWGCYLHKSRESPTTPFCFLTYPQSNKKIIAINGPTFWLTSVGLANAQSQGKELQEVFALNWSKETHSAVQSHMSALV